MVVMGVGAFICVPDTDDVKQQPGNNTKQIFPEQKTKKSFALRHLCPVHEVLSGILESINTWTNCQFICSGKGHIKLSVWKFQKLFLWQPCSCMLRIETLINFNMTCMWTFHTNSLLHGYLFLMHVHK